MFDDGSGQLFVGLLGLPGIDGGGLGLSTGASSAGAGAALLRCVEAAALGRAGPPCEPLLHQFCFRCVVK